MENGSGRSLPSNSLLPDWEQAIRDKCVHPTGEFIEFKREEIEQSIPERFEQQVRMYPDRLAVKERDCESTYDELNRTANQLARAILRRCGEGAEPIVLIFKHSVQAIAAIFSVLKSGKFYVPLDPAYPHARIASILEDSQARLIVTNGKYLPLIREFAKDGTQLLNMDALEPGLPAEDLRVSIPLDAYAYIIYTSGSTGEPKGVIENHRNVLHFAMSCTNRYHYCAEDRLALTASFSFTGPTSTIYPALFNGASLFPFDVNKEGVGSIADWFIREEITRYDSTPALFRSFTETLTGEEEFPSVRLINLGGDRVYKADVELYRKHFAPNCILSAGLGTSEVKSIRQYYVDKETQITNGYIPVGYPMEDIQVMLLDDDGKEVGLNQVGEIVVKSRYISPGYWRKPDMTQEKFRPDPDGGEERLYYTGDMGLMLPDGCLLHMGRKDFQVKIRGYRVETVEVETALLEIDAIKAAAVAAREDKPGEQQLVGYIVPATEQIPTVSSLRRALSEKLPDYMIPSAFVVLDAMPLNPNDKVDLQALPEPGTSRPQLETDFVAPRTPVEGTLAEIWSQVLGIDEVGIHDSFFDLGGHSLLASRIISQTINTFRVEVPLRSLFQSPTVADMAVVIAQKQGDRTKSEYVDRILAELEALSDEEMRRLLDSEEPDQDS
ncbi:amino acid adenylation domain-containing protein [Candidatus Poribacteria bacterium]